MNVPSKTTDDHVALPRIVPHKHATRAQELFYVNGDSVLRARFTTLFARTKDQHTHKHTTQADDAQATKQQQNSDLCARDLLSLCVFVCVCYLRTRTDDTRDDNGYDKRHDTALVRLAQQTRFTRLTKKRETQPCSRHATNSAQTLEPHPQCAHSRCVRAIK